MKIGIISDIHSNLPALQAVLLDLHKHNVKAIFNAGDNVGYSVFPNECIDILVSNAVISAMGNYDDAVAYNRPFCGCGEGNDKIQSLRLASLQWAQRNTSITNKHYLASLPKYPLSTINNIDIVVMHGGLNELNEFIYADDFDNLTYISEKTSASIVIMGHTHKSFSVKHSNKLFINPGSLGKPVDANPAAAYAILDLDTLESEFYRVEYDVAKNIDSLIKANIAEEIIEDLKTGIPFSEVYNK